MSEICSFSTICLRDEGAIKQRTSGVKLVAEKHAKRLVNGLDRSRAEPRLAPLSSRCCRLVVAAAAAAAAAELGCLSIIISWSVYVPKRPDSQLRTFFRIVVVVVVIVCRQQSESSSTFARIAVSRTQRHQTIGAP